MRVNFKSKGKWDITKRYLKKNSKLNHRSILEKYGELGVEALRQYTPKDTGLTANSWYYVIEEGKDRDTITWCNSNTKRDAIPVALLIQYGHATRNGGYVQGIDYINPALKPIFDNLAESVWKEVR